MQTLVRAERTVGTLWRWVSGGRIVGIVWWIRAMGLERLYTDSQSHHYTVRHDIWHLQLATVAVRTLRLTSFCWVISEKLISETADLAGPLAS